MKKRNQIKLIFAAVSVIILAMLWFLHWNEYGKSYKSLVKWGQGNTRYVEQIYYSTRVKDIITEWQNESNNPDDKVRDSNSIFLHLVLNQNAIWLEENGMCKEEYYVTLPYTKKSILFYAESKPTNELPNHTILQIKKPEQELSGQFYLDCGQYNFVFDTKKCDGGPSPGLFPKFIVGDIKQSIDYTSLIVSEEEYKKYKDSLTEIKSEQPAKEDNDDSRNISLEEKKSNWLKAEKLLYMEIDGQLLNRGYELRSLEVQTGPDYTGAYAIISASKDNPLHKYLGFDIGVSNINVYFKIDCLDNNIWYVKTWPHPKRKLDSDRKVNLEFLVFPDEQIPRSQYSKYIKQGRELQQAKDYLNSKWKAALPNGVIIKIIGITGSNEPRKKWWGPDGGVLEFPDYFTIKPMKNDENSFLIAWQIKFPEKIDARQMFFDLEGVKETYSIDARDKYGNTESVTISSFDDSRVKTNLRAGIKEKENISQCAIFKNISFVPGKNQGFEIEVQEAEE